MSGAAIELYFDYSSPFAYLASTQIERVAKEAEAELVYRPIFLAGLLKQIGSPIPPIASFPAPKQRHTFHDMMRWASHWGVPLRWPSRFPVVTVTAMRVTLVVAGDEPERMPALVREAFRAYWVDDLDLSDRAVLTGVLQRAGLDATLLERASEPAVKDALRRVTSEAVERGVFGVPTCIVRDELFWGQDRLDFVLQAASA